MGGATGGASEQVAGRPMRSRSRSLANFFQEPCATAKKLVTIAMLDSKPAVGASGSVDLEDDSQIVLTVWALPRKAAFTPPEPASGPAAEIAVSPARGHARETAASGPAAAHGGLAPPQNGSENVGAANRLADVLSKLEAKKDEKAQIAKRAKLEAAQAAKQAKLEAAEATKQAKLEAAQAAKQAKLEAKLEADLKKAELAKAAKAAKRPADEETDVIPSDLKQTTKRMRLAEKDEVIHTPIKHLSLIHI